MRIYGVYLDIGGDYKRFNVAAARRRGVLALAIRRGRAFIRDRIQTVAEVAKYLRMSRSMVYRLTTALLDRGDRNKTLEPAAHSDLEVVQLHADHVSVVALMYSGDLLAG